MRPHMSTFHKFNDRFSKEIDVQANNTKPLTKFFKLDILKLLFFKFYILKPQIETNPKQWH